MRLGLASLTSTTNSPRNTSVANITGCTNIVHSIGLTRANRASLTSLSRIYRIAIISSVSRGASSTHNSHTMCLAGLLVQIPCAHRIVSVTHANRNNIPTLFSFTRITIFTTSTAVAMSTRFAMVTTSYYHSPDDVCHGRVYLRLSHLTHHVCHHCNSRCLDDGASAC